MMNLENLKPKCNEVLWKEGWGSTEACQKEQGMSLKGLPLAKYRTI